MNLWFVGFWVGFGMAQLVWAIRFHFHRRWVLRQLADLAETERAMKAWARFTEEQERGF